LNEAATLRAGARYGVAFVQPEQNGDSRKLVNSRG